VSNAPPNFILRMAYSPPKSWATVRSGLRGLSAGRRRLGAFRVRSDTRGRRLKLSEHAALVLIVKNAERADYMKAEPRENVADGACTMRAVGDGDDESVARDQGQASLHVGRLEAEIDGEAAILRELVGTAQIDDQQLFRTGV